MQRDLVSHRSSSIWPRTAGAAAIVLALTTDGTPVQAAPVTTTPQTRTFLAEVSGNAPFTIPASATRVLFFDAFNASLGTLQQVVFRWDTALSASLTDLAAFGDPVSSINAAVGAQVIGLGQLFTRDFTASVPDDEETATITQSVTGSRTYAAPGDLAYFIGTGTFSTEVTLDVTVATDNDSASMSASWQTTPGTGLFSVEYVYEPPGTPVPEPGVLLLGAAALLGFGVAARRQQRGAKN